MLKLLKFCDIVYVYMKIFN